MVLMNENTTTPGASSQEVGRGRHRRVLAESIKIKEKIIYFYSLSKNYNNRLPAVGNDSQNGKNCSRRATIIYKQTKYSSIRIKTQ
jgi:hypothetical protein